MKAAGIASQRAAAYHGMNTIDSGIEDNPANETRLLVFSPEEIHYFFSTPLILNG